uniref:Acetyltransferase (Isoleucine patch superfamily)-like protein n=1 Tax=Solibacter usitatus (strain Ellin6076) TaxID=234267 RepID=Q01XL0_SOLUE
MKIGASCRLERVRIRHPELIELGRCNALTSGCWLWPSKPASSDNRAIRIGESNYFNRDVMIDACGRIEIGNHNMFGPGVYITDSNHVMRPDQWITETGMAIGRVVIGNGCWFGTRSTILKDVELGDRCIVAAGAVVTRSFPAGSVVGGVPAVLLKQQ